MAQRATLLYLTLVTSAAALPSWSNSLFPRGDCRVQTVRSGDSCASLAAKCGISGEDLAKYNPDPNLCWSLTLGEQVCCSPGMPPDIIFKREHEDTHATHALKKDDDYALPKLAPSPTTTTTTTTTSSSASSSSSSSSSSSAPTSVGKTVNCAYTYVGINKFYMIYNILGWADDGGKNLHHQEEGCGALEGWRWRDKAFIGIHGHEVTFSLPTLMKEGCVERAIKSAGGPDGVKCQLMDDPRGGGGTGCKAI
ncbi:hypothetical protein F4810DRAFT_717475 [Camillea tinctor]|nr:hypothetical protein F4810DRAFT_717475 [Camillea tinctor]